MTVGSQAELKAQLAVEIFVSNLKESLAFYRAIGFMVERSSQTFAVVRWQESYLFLDERKEYSSFSDLPAANVRVVVDNIEEIWRLVQSRGLIVNTPLMTQSYGLRDFTILDPDGFGIRFAEII